MSTSVPREGWSEVSDVALWDRTLAAVGGHPLQSALWGDARRAVDGIEDRRWFFVRDEKPAAMIRIEKRRLAGVGVVGWAPKGPTGDAGDAPLFPPREILRREGMVLLVDDPWREVETAPRPRAHPQTVWIDLSFGKEALWRNLDKQWRYGVGRAERSGVRVTSNATPGDLIAFDALCRKISDTKGFALNASPALMTHLLTERWQSGVEARLFCAHLENRLAAGAFVIRCGTSLHYFWGATDRSASQACAGEAVQWAAIEWALAQGCTRYDLEGIDAKTNPGTYAFKMKMGGRAVTLAGKRYHPLGLRGHILARLDRMRNG
jgi:peptidoglycan pentaglycine glycine transferase (the first glycine)